MILVKSDFVFENQDNSYKVGISQAKFQTSIIFVKSVPVVLLITEIYEQKFNFEFFTGKWQFPFKADDAYS